MNKIRHFGKGVDYSNQSLIYKDNSAERISKVLDSKRTLPTYLYETVLTLDDIFKRGYNESKNGKCLGEVNIDTKSIHWLTYGDVLKRCKYLADGLLRLGLEPRKNLVGIFSKNCPEFTLVEYGCYRHSIIVVPIYDTLGPDIASFITNQTNLTCIACDQIDRIEKIIEQKDQFKTLKHLILLKYNPSGQKKSLEEIRDQASKNGFVLYSLEELEHLGRKQPYNEDYHPKVNDLALICYTSGTTSKPKGVMLTHENVIASIASICVHLMDQHATVEDVMISILPLAHMFERIGEAAMFIEGGKVVYYSGNIRQLASEILIIQPTIMLAVPRIMNRIYDSIYAKVGKNILKRLILHTAYRQKQKDLIRRVIRHDTIWDRYVFDKVRENLGSKIRLICVGSAPLCPQILNFLRVAIGCVISEGYGQTECVGPCTATLIGDHTTGHLGPPLVNSIIKLIDVPDMGYLAKQGKGEILVKGPSVFQGYFGMPEQTRDTLDSDGWLHTGDIGCWTKKGTLVLIDRKKNIFKLAQGEYIAPEKIENILINSSYVEQIFVYGDGFKSILVAIVVVNLDQLEYNTNCNLTRSDEAQLNQSQIKQIILEDLKRIGLAAGLKSFEIPKNVYLRKRAFTIEEDLLTPTLKLKRNIAFIYFQKQIQMLYKELEQNTKVVC